MQNVVDGRFWISKSHHNFLGKGRIELLKQVGVSGSIAKAAKEMKMSYKAAWDAIDAMNNLADQPLVETSKGGKGGGGAQLTQYAKELIKSYEILNEEYQLFLHNLSIRIKDTTEHFSLLERLSMRVSARNQIAGKVIKIQKGVIDSFVSLELQGGDVLSVLVTNDSLKALDIKLESVFFALFKACSVSVKKGAVCKKNEQNCFIGSIERINKTEQTSEIIVALNAKNTICASLTTANLEKLELKEGLEVSLRCDAKNIILGTI